MVTATSQPVREIPKFNHGAFNDDPARKGVGPVEIRDDLPMPSPGPGQVLVNYEYSGLCQSDVEIFFNSWPDFFPPNVPTQGHEGIGHVVALGPGVTELRVGDRVGQKFIAEVCHRCEQCLAGWETYCEERYHSATQRPGTFQRYALAQASYLARIPEGVSLPAAAPMMCAGITVYKAIKVAACAPGQWLALVGAGGGLGHIGIQVCRALGVRCLALDVGAAKGDFCREMGADDYVDVTSLDGAEALAAEVVKRTAGGAHACVVVASHASGYAAGIKMLRPRGALVAVGLPPAEQGCVIQTDPFELVLRGIRVTGSNVGTREDMQECLELVAQGKVKPVYKIINLTELPATIEKYRHGGMTTKLVVDLYNRA